MKIENSINNLLTARENEAMTKRYLQGLTLKDIAIDMGISIERVRQIILKAIRKMHRYKGFSNRQLLSYGIPRY